MNKKILMASLGVLAIGAVAVFTQPSFRTSLRHLTSLAITTPDGPSIHPTADLAFTSEDGKKMYHLITTNADGQQIITDVEVPDSYMEDGNGTVLSTKIEWPHNFPRDVLDVTKEYYSSESVAVWAPWFQKNYAELFNTQRDDIRKKLIIEEQDLIKKTGELTAKNTSLTTCANSLAPVKAAFETAEALVTQETTDLAEARQSLIDKTELLKVKNAEAISANALMKTRYDDFYKEYNTTIPERKLAIKKEITANTNKIAANKKLIP
jgi:hypothetical protein